MHLIDVRDPLALWQYAERYLGAGTRTYSPYAGDLDIAGRYHPQTGTPTFTLPTFRVPADLGTYRHPAGPADDAAALYTDGATMLLPVHPNTLDSPGLPGHDTLQSLEPGPPLTAVPSANARTVFVTEAAGRPVEPHFVKLHYPRRLSRFTRRLRRPVIELQLWVSAELHRAGTPILPDVAGGWFDPDLGAQAWGFLVRAARPAVPAPAWTVPLFALYGRDRNAPADPTLLQQLVERFEEPPAAFVAARIVAPMVRLWCETALATGCPLETHGQNTLFAFDVATRQTKVLYRDCAVYVDSRLRADADLPGGLPPANVIPRDVPLAADEVFSLTYDSFMAHHALDYVAAVAADVWGVDETVLHDAARAAFTAPDLLPASTFSYDNVLYDNGDWKLVDTGRPPRWR
ncbi:ferric iron reductase [Dactylosporangium sp. NPDC051541]|uniref:ferric iron reductase n=1 Tax=Dactylosporangium sp. NPDC051541 TaxID=3363977 RepID=UPI00378D8534